MVGAGLLTPVLGVADVTLMPGIVAIGISVVAPIVYSYVLYCRIAA